MWAIEVLLMPYARDVSERPALSKTAMLQRVLCLLGWLFGMVATQAAALEIYFVRHAETLANVSGVHTMKTNTTFTQRGEEQIKKLTSQLKGHQFDAILVSSLPRALNTVLPYLRASSQTGEVWPELAECCWQSPQSSPTKGELVATAPITLSEEQLRYFTFRDSASQSDYRNGSYSDGVAQVIHGVQLLKQRYFGTNQTILIVAHYHSGQVLISELLGVPRQQLSPLKNGELLHLHQDDAGYIHLLPSLRGS
jgi:broad specificity phosphatase PhoE